MRIAGFATLALLVGLAACGEAVVAPPAPVSMSVEALSHYCQMSVAEHGGPKAQIHLEGDPAPLFFAQVRDALAYLQSAERTAPITAVYVSDMARAPSWEAPGADNWINAREAVFVVGADVVGGMGAPEIAPFGDRRAATAFAAQRGGTVQRLDEVPPEAVTGAVDIVIPPAE